MDAPWKKYVYHQFSMGWRMGPSQTYMREWRQWFAKQPTEEKKSYQNENPLPDGWFYFYDLQGPYNEDELWAKIDQAKLEYLDRKYKEALYCIDKGETSKADAALQAIVEMSGKYKDAKALLEQLR